jgi:hypothetical protein
MDALTSNNNFAAAMLPMATASNNGVIGFVKVDKRMLKLLLDRGFHFNHGTNTLHDQESLHLAVLKNDPVMVKILLNHQIKLDNELHGFTALDWAQLQHPLIT